MSLLLGHTAASRAAYADHCDCGSWGADTTTLDDDPGKGSGSGRDPLAVRRADVDGG